jgi:hypothetical protein
LTSNAFILTRMTCGSSRRPSHSRKYFSMLRSECGGT